MTLDHSVTPSIEELSPLVLRITDVYTGSWDRLKVLGLNNQKYFAIPKLARIRDIIYPKIVMSMFAIQRHALIKTIYSAAKALCE